MLGFHASHELYSPAKLLELTRLAQRAGFQAASCSDHFHPWSMSGQGGYAWSWLGAALESILLTFGTVCAPGQRYHPAYQKIAQIARIRASEPTLRYGRQFFCQVSGDGQTFGDSRDPGGVFAYSRILDGTSVVTAINVDAGSNTIFISLDEKFFPLESKIRNLMNGKTLNVVKAPDGQTCCISLEMDPREIAIWKIID